MRDIAWEMRLDFPALQIGLIDALSTRWSSSQVDDGRARLVQDDAAIDDTRNE